MLTITPPSPITITSTISHTFNTFSITRFNFDVVADSITCIVKKIDSNGFEHYDTFVLSEAELAPLATTAISSIPGISVTSTFWDVWEIVAQMVCGLHYGFTPVLSSFAPASTTPTVITTDNTQSAS